MTVQATYNGEEITVSFHATTERTDYGVPGSPIWDEVDPSSIQVASLEILGVEVAMKDLPADLQDAILSLSDEVEFENEY